MHSGDGKNLSTIVAFRGTEIHPSDFITNAQFRKQKERGIPGKWHRGFLGAARSAAPSVLTAIERSSSVTLVGHSLGGALAIVTAALLMEEMGSRIQIIVTFGAPRCCSLRASRWLENMLPPMSEKEQRRAFPVGKFISNNRIIQVKHDRDAIPCFPMAILNYRHCGKQVTIPHPTSSGLTSENGQQRYDRRRFRWRLKGLKGHSIKGYEDLLNQLA